MTAIAIVGGGFTGAAAAIHLVREARRRLDIYVIEPREQVGRGVAFSARDPDHRLNSLANLHVVYPNDPLDFEKWLMRTGGLERDPGMRAEDGALIPRRADFGAYMTEQFEAHVDRNPSGSSVHHVRSNATAVRPRLDGVTVSLSDRRALKADVAIIAANTQVPDVPPAFAETPATHAAFVADPWNLSALDAIRPGARILLLGAGLTAADVAATILRDKPGVTIEAMSRTGIRPTSRMSSLPGPPLPIWQRLDETPCLFEQRHGRTTTVRSIFRALRADIEELARRGQPWQVAFDDLRDSARHLWMQLSVTEKRRFLRHLRRRYDSCRFRHAPQTEAVLQAAERSGQLLYRRTSIDRATAVGARIEVAWTEAGAAAIHTRLYDAVVNCTGPSSRPDKSSNPMLQAIVNDATARVSAIGVGIDVDPACRVIAPSGTAYSNLYALGALTFATFGHAVAVPFIVHQIMRAIPGILCETQDANFTS